MGHLPRFTDAGKALHLRSLDGDPIIFTKMQVGSGVLGDTSARKLTALIEPKITVPISDIKVDDGYAAIRGYWSNESVTEGFYYRELGLFAQDPDDANKEILYAYSNTGEKSGYIAEANSRLIERSTKIIAIVDDAENVSAIINGSAVYPDFEDLKKAIEEHNNDNGAHAGVADRTLQLYVDSSTQEDAELRNGSVEHPYKEIDELLEKLPNNVRALSIYLKSDGEYAGTNEFYFDGFYGLASLEISFYGSGVRPTVIGSLQINNINDVILSALRFVPAAESEVFYGTSVYISACQNVVFSESVANYSLCPGGLLYADNSNIHLCGCRIIDANEALYIAEGCDVTLSNTSIIADTVMYIDASNAYLRDDASAYEGIIEMTRSSLVLTQDVITALSEGTMLKHMNSTQNPHRVSLTQAQKEGGLIDVKHGGTGQKTFKKGALLIGNEEDGIGHLIGKGVLCSSPEGNPMFKETLPINLGGTGATSFVPGKIVVGGENSIAPLTTLTSNIGALYYKNGSYQHGILPVDLGGTGQKAILKEVGTAAGNTGGVAPGNIVIPGTDILIAWGKVVIDISETGKTCTTMIKSTENGKSFANADYALVISGKDDDWGDLSKTADSFTLTTQNAVGSFVADWIAIGKVAS